MIMSDINDNLMNNKITIILLELCPVERVDVLTQGEFLNWTTLNSENIFPFLVSDEISAKLVPSNEAKQSEKISFLAILTLSKPI